MGGMVPASTTAPKKSVKAHISAPMWLHACGVLGTRKKERRYRIEELERQWKGIFVKRMACQQVRAID